MSDWQPPLRVTTARAICGRALCPLMEPSGCMVGCTPERVRNLLEAADRVLSKLHTMPASAAAAEAEASPVQGSEAKQ
jgi:hypothetical protein